MAGENRESTITVEEKPLVATKSHMKVAPDCYHSVSVAQCFSACCVHSKTNKREVSGDRVGEMWHIFLQ